MVFDLDCYDSSANTHQFSFRVLSSCGAAALTTVGPGTSPVLEAEFSPLSGISYVGITTGDGSAGNFRLYLTTVQDLVLSSGVTTFNAGQYSFANVHISSGASVYISGAVTFNLTGNFTLDTGATVNGTSGGYNYSIGGGPGEPSGEGGGGGHGGIGGGTNGCGSGGGNNDTSTAPALMGSSGADGSGTNDRGYGGGLFVVNAPNGIADLSGNISMNGGNAYGEILTGGGGGAGGSIYIRANIIQGNGSLNVNGGAGGGGGLGCGGGGGGGGMIELSNHTGFTFSGGSANNGGSGGLGTGSVYGNFGNSGTFDNTPF